jgi:hypothetical protein
MNRFVLKYTFIKVYIYHFWINIFIEKWSQSYALETVSLSKTTSFTNMERVQYSAYCNEAASSWTNKFILLTETGLKPYWHSIYGHRAIRPCLDTKVWPPNSLYRISILRHIKISVYIWSTKYRWNKNLIAQFCCTLRDEHFKPN